MLQKCCFYIKRCLNYFFMLDFKIKSCLCVFVVSLLLVAIVCNTCMMKNAKPTLEMRRNKSILIRFLSDFISLLCGMWKPYRTRKWKQPSKISVPLWRFLAIDKERGRKTSQQNTDCVWGTFRKLLAILDYFLSCTAHSWELVVRIT